GSNSLAGIAARIVVVDGNLFVALMAIAVRRRQCIDPAAGFLSRNLARGHLHRAPRAAVRRPPATRRCLRSLRAEACDAIALHRAGAARMPIEDFAVGSAAFIGRRGFLHASVRVMGCRDLALIAATRDGGTRRSRRRRRIDQGLLAHFHDALVLWRCARLGLEHGFAMRARAAIYRRGARARGHRRLQRQACKRRRKPGKPESKRTRVHDASPWWKRIFEPCATRRYMASPQDSVGIPRRLQADTAGLRRNSRRRDRRRFARIIGPPRPGSPMNSRGIAFHHPLAFWIGCLAVTAGVCLHMPMYLMAAPMHYHLAGMAMDTPMAIGMFLIPAGVLLAGYGLMPHVEQLRQNLHGHGNHRYFHIADGVPLNQEHWKLVIVLVAALTVDVMKPASIAFVMPGMAHEYAITKSTAGYLALSALTGTAVGSVVWGRIADLFGRRAAILLSAIMFMGTAICGTMPSFGWNLVMCFLMGAAAGGMLPIAFTLMAETIPTAHRGWLLVALGGIGTSAGYLAASGAATLLEPTF